MTLSFFIITVELIFVSNELRCIEVRLLKIGSLFSSILYKNKYIDCLGIIIDASIEKHAP